AVADAEVIGVVGPVYHNEVLAAGPILEKAGLPWITPFSPDVDLAKQGWKTFHRIIGTDADQAAAGARYLKTTLSAKKVVVVYDDSDYGAVGRTEASSALGSAVSGTVSINRSSKDFTAQVKQVTDANPDAVSFAGQADDGGIFVKALRTAKPSMPIVSSDKLFTQ